MPIEFTCQQCGREYRVDDAMAGRLVRCLACGKAVLVPRSDIGTGAPVATRRDKAAAQVQAEAEAGAEAAGLKVLARMEAQAQAFERPQVVKRRRFKKAEPEPELPAGAYRPPRHFRDNWKMSLIALVPLVLALGALYLFVPWDSLLGGLFNSGGGGTPATSPDRSKAKEGEEETKRGFGRSADSATAADGSLIGPGPGLDSSPRQGGGGKTTKAAERPSKGGAVSDGKSERKSP